MEIQQRNMSPYPLDQPIEENKSPLKTEFDPEEGNSLLLITVGKALYFKNKIEDDMINNFISNSPSVTQLASTPKFHHG